MEIEQSLISGFPPSNTHQVDRFFQTLIPHLKEGQYSVVGGLAIRYRLSQHGIKYPDRDFNDLDLKAKSPAAVLPSVTSDFMVYHYHPLKDRSFYIVLVDPENKIKVDIFDSATIAEERTSQVPFHQWKVDVVEAEDQLVKTAFDLSGISGHPGIDPKHFTDAKLLIQIVKMELANQIWKSRNYIQFPATIDKAIRRAETIASKHPAWVVRKPYRRPSPYICPDCVQTKDFPITDMQKIYKILGYVE